MWHLGHEVAVCLRFLDDVTCAWFAPALFAWVGLKDIFQMSHWQWNTWFSAPKHKTRRLWNQLLPSKRPLHISFLMFPISAKRGFLMQDTNQQFFCLLCDIQIETETVSKTSAMYTEPWDHVQKLQEVKKQWAPLHLPPPRRSLKVVWLISHLQLINAYTLFLM